MRNAVDLGNVITAMVTPFSETGAVDLEGMGNLAQYLVNNGTDTLLLAGSTGEAAQLTADEKWLIIDHVRRRIPQGTKIMLSTGDTNTQRAIEKAKRAFEIGADAILVSVPEYIKPSQQAQFVHFNAIAKAIDGKPMMIYNIPGRTGKEILPQTVAKLATENPNIIGIKQSMPDMDKLSKLRMLCPKDFQIYSGDDSLTLPMLALGAKGVVSVMSHLEGKKIQAMIQSFKKGFIPLSQSYHQILYPLFSRVSMHDNQNGDDYANPLPIKEALYQRGLIASPRTRTLGEMSDASKQEMRDTLALVDRETKAFDAQLRTFRKSAGR